MEITTKILKKIYKKILNHKKNGFIVIDGIMIFTVCFIKFKIPLNF